MDPSRVSKVFYESLHVSHQGRDGSLKVRKPNSCRLRQTVVISPSHTPTLDVPTCWPAALEGRIWKSQ